MLYVANAEIFDAGILDDRRGMIDLCTIASLEIEANRRIDNNGPWLDSGYRAAKPDAFDRGVAFAPYAAHSYLGDKRTAELSCKNDVISYGKPSRALDGYPGRRCEHIGAEPDR